MRKTFASKAITRLATGALAATSALCLTAAPASAQAITMSTQTAKSIVNPCTGEPVLVTGTVHIEQHEQVSKRGAIHYQTVVSSKGFRGTTADPVNPATYVTSDGQLSQFNSGSATESTYAQRQVYNRLGENGRFVKGDDFRLTLSVHTTIDANGRITSFKLIELQPEPTCN